VLNHRNPAVVGLGCEVGLAFLDVGKGDLLELFLVGIDCRAGEGRDHRTLAFRRLNVALQLVVGVRCDLLLATIVDFMGDVDQIAAAGEGIDFWPP
jgi:hypothetical protein